MELEVIMPEVSITQQIFLRFFQELKDKCHMDEEIISQLKKLYEENKLSDPIELNNFIQWLQEYDVKD